MESTIAAKLRQDVIDIMDGEKKPNFRMSFDRTAAPMCIYEVHKHSVYGELPDSDESRDHEKDPVCAFGRKVIDEAFPPEPTDVASVYDPVWISNYILRGATFGMEYTKEYEWKNNCSSKDILKKYNADPVPWIKRTTHTFDLMYLWYTHHGYRCAENFPEELVSALGGSENLARRMLAAQVLVHECDRAIRGYRFHYGN